MMGVYESGVRSRALPEEDELVVDGVRLCYRIQVSARRRTLCLRDRRAHV